MRIRELLKELAVKIPGLSTTDRLVASEANHYSVKYMPEKTVLADFRYLREISIRKLDPMEDVENGIKLQIHFTIPSTYGYSNTERRTFGQYNAIFLPKSATTKQIHQHLFKVFGMATEIKDYEKEIMKLTW